MYCFFKLITFQKANEPKGRIVITLIAMSLIQAIISQACFGSRILALSYQISNLDLAGRGPVWKKKFITDSCKQLPYLSVS